MKPTEFESSGRFAAYIRVSTMHQARSGLGMGAQISNCLSEAKRLGLKPMDESYQADGVKIIPGCFLDAGESAYNTRLEKRAGGSRLLAALKPGDTLIISRLDRAFRNVRDFIMVSDDLLKRGIRLVLCSPTFDMGTALGRAQAGFLAVIAEWESSRRGERISAALKQRTERIRKQSAEEEPEESLPSEYRPANKEQPQDENGCQPGRVFIYIRCSHRDSVESGLGLLHQAEVAKSFMQGLIERNPVLTEGTVYTDPAVSAHNWPLKARAAGGKMLAELKSGDHVVFSTLDRGFRNISDMAETTTEWNKNGIHCHFAADGLSMDDPGGRMLANIAVLFAQMEAEVASDRAKESRAQLASKGQYVGGPIPCFWKVYRNGKAKRLVIDRKRVAECRLLLLYRNTLNLSIEASCERLEAIMAKRERRRPISIWGQMTLKGFVDNPNKVPPSLIQGGNNYWFPFWTKKRFQNTLPQYEAAAQVVRNIAAKARELRELPVVEQLAPKKPNTRGWTDETETAWLGTPKTKAQLDAYAARLRQERGERERQEELDRLVGDGI